MFLFYNSCDYCLPLGLLITTVLFFFVSSALKVDVATRFRSVYFSNVRKSEKEMDMKYAILFNSVSDLTLKRRKKRDCMHRAPQTTKHVRPLIIGSPQSDCSKL